MYSVVKGTHDVVLDEADRYTYIEELLKSEAEVFGFREFRTPIIEYSDLFVRSVGDSSDIVRKEMYTFLDKGDRSITLRPEFTAGIVRAMVEGKMFVNQDYPVKAYYVGPCFRYERPQQGRYRQFNQFGVETIGTSSPLRDVETITLAYLGLKLLGFENVELKINTLGDEKTRVAYRQALKEYFLPHISSMCEDCKARYETNVLRILDCKVDSDRILIEKAPKIGDYLTEEAKSSFEFIKSELDRAKIPYSLDETLVRGLDYYSGVVFEFHYTSKSGKNYGAIGAGGHYSNLVNELGGPNIEGIGFAMGIERLASVMEDDGLFDSDILATIDLYVMPLGGLDKEALELAEKLRLFGFKTEVCLEDKGISQMFKKAERRGAKYALIFGKDELDKGTYNLKDLETKEQKSIGKDKLIETLDGLFHEEENE
jgi:histidyl-tRNA synthetase